MEEEAKQAKSKKVRVTTPPEFDSVDLTSTPLHPSPTQIVQEEISNLTFFSTPNPYREALFEKLKEKFDKDVDLQ